jgi:hypothetical protein
MKTHLFWKAGFVFALMVSSGAAHVAFSANIELKDGDVVRLKCLGAHPKANVRWLSGNTASATVELKEDRNAVGTRWKLETTGSGMFFLRCLDKRGHFHYLDGNTVENKVLLRENTADYSGTKWRVVAKENQVRLECQGSLPGPKWLFGHTVRAHVNLSDADDGPATKWEVFKE